MLAPLLNLGHLKFLTALLLQDKGKRTRGESSSSLYYPRCATSSGAKRPIALASLLWNTVDPCCNPQYSKAEDILQIFIIPHVWWSTVGQVCHTSY